MADSDDADDGWPDGLVATGGNLAPETLLRAYRAGVFPWSSDPVLTWWSPDPRAIFDLETYAPSRSLRKTIRRHGWTFSVDRAFRAVMEGCAEQTEDRPGTWITGAFVDSYTTLHARGFAHSVEVWEGEHLVGGLYGVTVGGFFGGESMFRRRTDASKAAVSHLIERLRACGFVLLDAQVPTPHLMSLGAIAIPRTAYLRRLQEALALDVRFS